MAMHAPFFSQFRRATGKKIVLILYWWTNKWLTWNILVRLAMNILEETGVYATTLKFHVDIQ